MNDIEIERMNENESKQRSPVKAIRAYCLWCCCESSNEVKLCPETDCPLHSYRFGKKKGFVHKLTPIKAIRARCVDCVGGCTQDANRCKCSECALHAYRTGHRPRKGISPSETCEPVNPIATAAFSENKTNVEGGAASGE